MSLREKYVKILSRILPAGALGVTLLLGATGPSDANQPPESSQPLASGQDRVSERLAAIRAAVSAVVDPVDKEAKPGDGNLQLAWGNWWNGGWGWPNWPNWRNWNNWNNWWRNW